MSAPHTTLCPECSSSHTQRVTGRTWLERAGGLIYLYPFRCQVCSSRFTAFKWGIRYRRQIIEKRKHERLKVDIEARLLRSDESCAEAKIFDLSEGGCGLKPSHQLEPGEVVSIEMMLGGTEFRIESAIVRSSTLHRAGIEFLALGEAGHIEQMKRNVLRQYLQIDAAA